MQIECVPVRFEAIDKDTIDLLFVVEAHDTVCASVEIKTVVTLESWRDISAQIEKCIIAMNLE